MRSITFDATAGAFVLDGNKINLNGNITNNTAGINQTINLGMNFSGDRTINAAAGDITVGGVISGVGSLTKSGTNTVVLAGSNTYSGTTTISAGTLQIGDGGTAGKLGTGKVVNDSALTFNRSDVVTVGNAISGTGSLTQFGAGTTILTNANTYSGLTTISAGTLQVGNGGAAGSLGTNTVINNAALAFNRNNAVKVANILSGSGSLIKLGTNTLTLTGNNTYSGATVISGGTLQIGSGSTAGVLGTGLITNNATLAFNRSDAVTVGPVISGSGSLTQMGKGTLTLTNANTYSGGTRISAGILQVGNGGTTGTLGAGNITNNAALKFNRSDALVVSNSISGVGSLTKLGAGTTTLAGSNTYSGTTTISAGTLQIGDGGIAGKLGTGKVVNNSALIFNRSDVMTVGNAISGTGSLTQFGAGTTILTNANTYKGTTTISAGTLQVGNGGAAGSLGTNKVVNNAALAFNRNNAVTVANILSGSGSLIKLGANTLTLTGSNTYSGATVISGGTLQIGSGSTAGVLGTGPVINNATLAFNRRDSITVSNTISGTGSLTKLGANILTLTSANTYSGETMIRGGALVSSNALALQNSTVNYTNNGGLLKFGNGAVAYTVGALVGDKALSLTNMNGKAISLTVGGNASDTIYSGVLSAGGSLVKIGAGTMILAGTNTYSGGTTISAGILQVGNGGTAGTMGSGNVTNNAALVFNRSDSITVNNTISGTGSLTKAGAGILHLNGTNTYSGLTTVSSGELIVNGSLQSEIVVSFGAFLAGSGTVGGNASIGGTHTLGNSPGVQIFERDLTYESGAEVIWELAKNTMMPEEPPVFDQMIINGDLRFTGLTTLTLTCNVDGGIVDWSDSFWDSDKSWLICDVAGSTYGFANLSISLDDWMDNDGGLLSVERSGATFSLKQEGSDIVLNYVIPEPTVINLVGIAGVFMLIIRRFHGRMATQC